MEEVKCRDFALTEGLEQTAQQQIAELRDAMHKNLDVHVYLKKEGKNFYSALIRTRNFGKDFFAKITGSDIYLAMAEATDTLIQNMRHFGTRKRQLVKHRVQRLKHPLDIRDNVYKF